MICFSNDPLDGFKPHELEIKILCSDGRRHRFRGLGNDGCAITITPRFTGRAEASSTLKQHTLILLALICIAVLGFQVYVVTYALTHNDENRAWLPSICASATILRSVCTDTVLLAVAFDIMSDKTFPIDTPAARERFQKSQQAPEQKSTN